LHTGELVVLKVQNEKNGYHDGGHPDDDALVLEIDVQVLQADTEKEYKSCDQTKGH
jgi:hypothetical protein